MTIRYGVSPIAWSNDDMPELGGDTPLETILGDTRDIGFDGIELGGRFPRDPEALGELLGRFDLDLVGGWYSSSLLERSAADEIAAMQERIALLHYMDSTVFIIAETSNAVHGDRRRRLDETPRLAASDWQQFGARLTEVADYVRGQGLRFAYHHHLGTVVETDDDLRNFLAHTGPSVGLVLDSGHAAYGGIDPVEVVRTVPDRISHVHCKDVRRAVHQRMRDEGRGFLDGVVAGMFTAPGDGDYDHGPLIHALKGMDYSGWIIVEAEQDPGIADPRA